MSKLSAAGTALIVGLACSASYSFAANLSSCLDGRYPALCDHSSLTPAQLQEVRKAEHRANLKNCLDGRYPALCRHYELSPDEAARVEMAEHAANFHSCLDGRYPALCRHGDLTADEAARVQIAEHAANLRVCLDGRYSSLCRHDNLTLDEAAKVQRAEAMHPSVASRPLANPRKGSTLVRRGASSCESGHWIESVTDDGSIIKLEDGSVWQVDDADTVDSALWLAVSDVVVCDDKIINTDENETVQAVRLR